MNYPYTQKRESARTPVFIEATVGIEPTIKVLQTSALPLGYVAIYVKKYTQLGGDWQGQL